MVTCKFCQALVPESEGYKGFCSPSHLGKYARSKHRPRWAYQYQHCAHCQTTEYKHDHDGYCTRCRRFNPKMKEQYRLNYQRNKEKILQRNKAWAAEHNYYSTRYQQKKSRLDRLRKEKYDLKYYGGNRERAIINAREKCNLCGMTREEHRKTWGNDLHIHHLDRNRSNNELNNLQVLCLKCHNIEHKVESQEAVRKLSLNDILDIRELYSSGISPKELSVVYNIHPSTALRVATKKSWKHID